MARPATKRQRLTRQQAREALLDAGRRLLIERGLDAGLGLVTLNDAVTESGVARASAYRIFADDALDPQDAFRLELLVSYIEAEPLEHRRKAFHEITELAVAALAADDPVELAVNLREAIRLAFAGELAPLAEDANWRVVGPNWAATALADWAPARLVEAHRRAAAALVRYQLPLFQRVIGAAGLRLRPGFEWESWGLITQSAVAVDSFSGAYHPELLAIMRPTGPDGEVRPWTQAAVLMEGLARVSLEPDPSAERSADLSVWDA